MARIFQSWPFFPLIRRSPPLIRWAQTGDAPDCKSQTLSSIPMILPRDKAADIPMILQATPWNCGAHQWWMVHQNHGPTRMEWVHFAINQSNSSNSFFLMKANRIIKRRTHHKFMFEKKTTTKFCEIEKNLHLGLLEFLLGGWESPPPDVVAALELITERERRDANVCYLLESAFSFSPSVCFDFHSKRVRKERWCVREP